MEVLHLILYTKGPVHSCTGEGGSPSAQPDPSHSLEPSGAGSDLAIRRRQCPITPLLLPLPAVQALASPGYLSLRWVWAARQPTSEACLHLGPALGSWGAKGTERLPKTGMQSSRTCLGRARLCSACRPSRAEGTRHHHLVAVGAAIFEGRTVN
uniref:Uncharacterized protein n=1 Tax=Pipistrellus kuhlii TaxID=59472 RepID=A0A7J7ZJH4_PIPKU|nr:hypothetical protein mPipKuh1_009532 [Pipistrellus kuhlii]